METTIVYLGYIRIMEKKMETTIVYWVILGLYRPLFSEQLRLQSSGHWVVFFLGGMAEVRVGGG